MLFLYYRNQRHSGRIQYNLEPDCQCVLHMVEVHTKLGPPHFMCPPVCYKSGCNGSLCPLGDTNSLIYSTGFRALTLENFRFEQLNFLFHLTHLPQIGRINEPWTLFTEQPSPTETPQCCKDSQWEWWVIFAENGGDMQKQGVIVSDPKN